MASAQHLVALIESYIERNDDKFLTVAVQIAARQARQGHSKVARELRDLIDQARNAESMFTARVSEHPMPQLRDELVNLLSVSYPGTRLASMALPNDLKEKLQRVLHEQKQQSRLKKFGLQPRRKLLFVGPPGSGKTMTASALAGELGFPLFKIRLDGVITKYMGETAAQLRLIFTAMMAERGIYLFDEFDAIGSNRGAQNDVGEIRRILNSFLQFLEDDESLSIIIAATNHAELLDRALFRRFDDIVRYGLPDSKVAEEILKSRLAMFDVEQIEWGEIAQVAAGLSQAEISRAADDAAKTAVLEGHTRPTFAMILASISERVRANG